MSTEKRMLPNYFLFHCTLAMSFFCSGVVLSVETSMDKVKRVFLSSKKYNCPKKPLFLADAKWRRDSCQGDTQTSRMSSEDVAFFVSHACEAAKKEDGEGRCYKKISASKRTNPPFLALLEERLCPSLVECQKWSINCGSWKKVANVGHTYEYIFFPFYACINIWVTAGRWQKNGDAVWK